MEPQLGLPQPEQLSYHPKHHIKVYVWIALVVAAVLVAINGYLYFLRLSYLQQGLVAYQEGEQKILELQSQGQLEVLSDWQTYRNEEYGFEFRYPARLQQNTADTRYIDFVQLGGHSGSIRLEVIPESLNPNSIRGFNRVVDQSGLIQVTIGGKMSYKYLDGDAGCGGPNYRVPLGATVHLSIRFTDCELQVPYIRDKIDQIISTFRFIDQSDTSIWQTYTNKIYGFELKRPATGEVYNTSTPLGEEFRFYVRGSSAVAIVLKIDSTTFCTRWGSNYSNLSYNPCIEKTETPLLIKNVGTIKYSLYCIVEGGIGGTPPLTLSDNEICKNVSETFTKIAREPISTWKTYRSTIYGIEFKYPPSLCLKEGTQELLSGSSGLGLFLENCPNNYDPYTTRRYLQNGGPEFIGMSFIKDSRPVKEQLDPSAPREQIMINSISGYYAPKTLFMERTGITISTSRWLFSSPTGYSIFIEDKPEITSQILSTFKFIE